MDADTLAENVLAATLGTIETLTISLGHQLGLYRELHQHGPLTPDGLAARAGIHPRYAREWLEQQSVVGLVNHEGSRFSLPPEHVPVLLDPDSLSYLAPLADLMAAAAAQLPAIVTAYRTGQGGLVGRLRSAHAPSPGRRQPTVVPRSARRRVAAQHSELERHSRRRRSRPRDRVRRGLGEHRRRHWPRTQVDALDIDHASIDAARDHARERAVHDRSPSMPTPPRCRPGRPTTS